MNEKRAGIKMFYAVEFLPFKSGNPFVIALTSQTAQPASEEPQDMGVAQ
jgi:hypothetical protein